VKAAVQSNWPTKRLRFLVRRTPTDEQLRRLSQTSQVNFLPMEAIGEKGEIDLSIIRDQEDVKTGYTLFFDGDVIIAKITPCFENGKGAFVEGLQHGIGYGTTELYVLSPGPELVGRFLYYVTASESFRKMGASVMTGAAGQKRVPEDFVRDYPGSGLLFVLQNTLKVVDNVYRKELGGAHATANYFHGKMYGAILKDKVEMVITSYNYTGQEILQLESVALVETPKENFKHQIYKFENDPHMTIESISLSDI
jgi:hypothetical protein